MPHRVYYRRLRRFILITCLGTLVLPASALAQAPTTTAGRGVPPLLVSHTAEQLTAFGCERNLLADTQAVAAARSLGWRAVVPADADGVSVFTCSADIAAQLQPGAAGRVAGIAEAQEILADPFLYYGSAIPSEAEKTTATAEDEDAWIYKKAKDATIWALTGLFGALSKAGFWLLGGIVEAIDKLLSLSDFITHKTVREAWPWILGIANLAFMIVLLLIALFTALNLEVGGGWRRLLPRLLLAALLVNFSLVIGGAILDLSRVVMALIPLVLTDSQGNQLLPGVATLGEDLIEASRVAEVSVELTRFFEIDNEWSEVIRLGISAVLVWLIAVCLAIVAVGLLIRYLVLIFLLIISPLAYVSVVLPSTAGLARQWWSTFLRYVIYAPVVLFILLGVASSTSVVTDLVRDAARPTTALYADILAVAVVGAGAILAAMAGRFAGIVGSAAAIGLAVGGGQRLRGAAYRGGRTTVRTAGRGAGAVAAGTAGFAYRRSGAQEKIQDTRSGIRDFYRQATKPIRKRLGLGEFGAYDDRGRLRPGRETRFTRAGRAVGRVLDRDEATAVNGVREANRNRARQGTRWEPTDYINNPGMRANNLVRPVATEQLSREVMRSIHFSGAPEQQQAVAAGLTQVSRLNDDQFKEVVGLSRDVDDGRGGVREGRRDWLRSVVHNVNVVSNLSGTQKSQLTEAALTTGDTNLMRDLTRTLANIKASEERQAGAK